MGNQATGYRLRRQKAYVQATGIRSLHVTARFSPLGETNAAIG
ncbi:hypothetical protein IMCC3135_30685 [Granulosicoccus antarcticus IMCC3135]|uniref:Uncharacterized protein n=1 Tax=Granulosicoccus antarcticus IMCC3135 TaxID=1192854 RepID=A0A2Z2NXK7_9GAMM|nr:hypothetical protein IMCC3135_30685 [Granulosicoccus antarcticus IMCC3135]